MMVVCVQEHGNWLGGIHSPEGCVTMLGALLVVVLDWGICPITDKTKSAETRKCSVLEVQYQHDMLWLWREKMNSFTQVNSPPGPQEERLCKVGVAERMFHVSSLENTGEMLSTNP